MKFFVLPLLSILFFIPNSFSQVTLVQFSTGFTNPIDLTNAGDSRIFVVEQAGKIFITDSNGVKKPIPFLDIHTRVISGGERGLLGLAFPPDYASSGFFYVNYTMQTNGATRISRFSVSPTNPDTALPNSEQVLLTIHQPFANHNGGNIEFGPDGYLYIGMGDGGSSGDPSNRAQNLDSLLGKMLRIDVSGGGNYSIPPTNPFVGKPGRDEIWAYGLRNPWRWSFDRLKGDLWIGDVGQNEYEEVDYQPGSSPGGENYGWRCYEGLHAYNTTGCAPQSSYVSPVLEIAQTPTNSCSVIAGYVYRGAEYSNMFGTMFLTDECNPNIKTLVPNGSGGFTMANLGTLNGSTLVSFGEDKWGEIYVVAYGGTIYKFKGANCSPVAYISDQSTIHSCAGGTYKLSTPPGNGFSYAWKLNGSVIPGATSSTYTASQSGNYTVTVTNRQACTATSSQVNLLFDLTTPTCPTMLSMKIFLEGFYLGSRTMIATVDPETYPTLCDTITAELHNVNPPYGLVYSSKSTISTSGQGTFQFPPSATGNNYYIAIQHRNSIETWSKFPVQFITSTTYDFSTSATKAYDDGYNLPMKQMESSPAVWALYTGDINHDDDVSSLDMTLEENDSNVSLFGYYDSDLNGDNASNSLDMTMIENNCNLSVYGVHP